MCCLVGWRVCFRGCGAPEIGKSLNSGREEEGKGSITVWRGAWDWLGLEGLSHLASGLLIRDRFLWDVSQASRQASGFSLLRFLFFDPRPLQRSSYLLRTGLPWVEGRDMARAGSEWQPQRCFQAGSRLCRRLVNI